jgi:formamidopyrimidine-DNA glycosylase
MPELPEVQTTVNGLNQTVKNKKIIAVSTTYNSPFYNQKEEIKNPQFFKEFKKRVIGRKILNAERRAKNILIHLTPQRGTKATQAETILVHMKMTGYFFYNPPEDAPFIRLTFTLDNQKILAFSDMRKFAKVTLIPTDTLHQSPHLQNLGPEPLENLFSFSIFQTQLLTKPRGVIKQVLMDQSVIAGIGNIYSDEILWQAGVHPLSRVSLIPQKNLDEMYRAIKETLKHGLDFGGDSMSDYRNIHGEKGNFQKHHHAYQKHKQKCLKRGCRGILEKIKVGTRSTHFCPVHQKLFA